MKFSFRQPALIITVLCACFAVVTIFTWKSEPLSHDEADMIRAGQV